VPPSQVTSVQANSFTLTSGGTPIDVVFLSFKVGGKNYRFQVVPFGVSCQKVVTSSDMICPDEGIAQELAVSNYISQAIPKLASGALGSPIQVE